MIGSWWSRKPFADGKVDYLLAEGRLINLGCATGHPSFVMSNSFTTKPLLKLTFATSRSKDWSYRLSKELDEEVARLHLDKLGAKLTELRPEQADYIGGKYLDRTNLSITDTRNAYTLLLI